MCAHARDFTRRVVVLVGTAAGPKEVTWSTMDEPLNRALKGDIGTREAKPESARQLNELFSQRPEAWK